MKLRTLLPIGISVRKRKDCLTLRIKKVYFDRIKTGEKSTEYRSATPFYNDKFKIKPHFLYLHYQGQTGLICQVNSISKIKTPKKLQDSKIDFGTHVYKINLGGCREITNR